MDSFTFDELDGNAKAYANDPDVLRLQSEQIASASDCFAILDWRFNEHGDRIS